MTKFIAFEGPDCSGKSTKIKHLKSYLESNDLDVVTTREPGGTQTGEAVRNILLDRDNKHLLPMSEVLLLLAQRLQNIHEVIKPALDQGKWVISDRFSLSTLVYQGHGRGLPLAEIRQLSQQVLENFAADLTVVVDVSAETSISRLGQRGGVDRFESLPQSFYQNVRDGYITEAQVSASPSVVINGDQPIELVTSDLLVAVNSHFGGNFV